MNRALIYVARGAKLRLHAGRFRRLAAERLEDRSLLALVGYDVRIVAPDGPLTGPDLTRVVVGESYDLAVTVRDLRAAPEGVFSGYLDIGYDSSKTRVRVAEVQQISIGPSPAAASGSFSLQFGELTTGEIVYTADRIAMAAAVESALAGLAGVGAGNVSVAADVLDGNLAMVLQVRFPGKFYDQNVANLSVAGQSLTGPGDPQVSITHPGDLAAGSNAFAFKEAFRSRGAQAVYPNGLSADDLPNLLDEVGAFSGLNALHDGLARELVRARMVATAVGQVTFTPDVTAMRPLAHDTQVYAFPGINPVAAPDDIDVGLAKILNIDAPNVAPSFVKGPDQAANDESGPQSVEGWATAISAGPASEAVQALSFSVTASDPGLFAVQPAIDGSGKLTFTPKLNAEGTTDVTVVLRDNGGTAGSGVDASAAQTFSIQIEKFRPLHNAAMPLDASGDGDVVAGDALECINYINAYGTGAIEDLPVEIERFLDVDGDRHLSPNDPLTVINYLNAFGPSTGGDDEPEGESGGAEDAFASLVALLAEDGGGQGMRRRGRYS